MSAVLTRDDGMTVPGSTRMRGGEHDRRPGATSKPFGPPRLERRGAVEWPTLGLCAAIYGGWASLIWFHAHIPLVLLLPLGAWFIAWQSSLQHELAHGHPTRIRWVNDLLASPALWLWIPYQRYRTIHLLHHRDTRLTDPLDDPETSYLTAAAWARLGPIGRALVRAQRTLLGRLIIGPAWAIPAYWASEYDEARRGDRQAVRDLARSWAIHVPAVAVVLGFAVGIAGLSIWTYLAMVYAGTSLAMIRSFAEHRAAENWQHRTAIIEDAPVLGLLFLYNNLHVVHHDRPCVPWYRIPSLYRANRDALIAQNGGLVYRGYADVAARYLLRPHDTPVHPTELVRAASPS